MQGELALVALVIAELVIVSTTAKWGREWLYGGIVVNLLLASALGMKTISVFGFETSSGNVFYASALFAILLLVEMYDSAAARKGVLLGAMAVIGFLLACQLVIAMPSPESSLAIDAAMRQLFDAFSRVSFASLVALLVSSNVAITVYAWMESRYADRQLWLRNIMSVGLSQMVDSVLFFSMAFLGTVSNSLLLQYMVMGFVLKFIFGVLSTPFLASNQVVIKEKEIA